MSSESFETAAMCGFFMALGVLVRTFETAPLMSKDFTNVENAIGFGLVWCAATAGALVWFFFQNAVSRRRGSP